MDRNNNPSPTPPVSSPPPPPLETPSIPHFILHTFPPPIIPSTTPIANTNTSQSSSHHRRKRPKLLHIGPSSPPLSTSTTTEATSSSSKPPSRKPDPSAPKITPPCTECGKTFWSWKALFGHMRCHPERQWRGINPPPHLRRSPPPPPSLPPPPATPAPSADDREVANSLLLLGGSSTGSGDDRTDIVATPARFECSSCKKTFPTHQALGGHRASHKNVKGCFAITRSGVEEEGNNIVAEGHNCHFTGNADTSIRLGLRLGLGLGLTHRCVICSKVFTSGQALGGHMRCHGDKNEEASTSSVGPGLRLVTQLTEAQCSGLDLNLPPQEEDVDPPVSSSSSSSMQLDLRLGYD